MKKFFNLLVMVAMCLAVSTNVCAQTKRTQTRKTATTTKKTTTVKKATTSAAKPKPQMVDMGLSVKWSNIDLGAATTKSGGAMYAATTDVAAQCGEGWRLPTLSEFNELLTNCDKSIKETNGVPTCVEFTSRNNGAKLYFYFPKTILKNPDKAITLSNPRDGAYLIYFHLNDGSGKALGCMKMENASPQARQLKALLAKVGLSKMKYSEWPNEVRVQIKPLEDQGGFFSDYMDWIGFATDHADISTVNVCIRPVYSVNDDEEEEELAPTVATEKTNETVGKSSANQEQAQTDGDAVLDNAEQAPSFPGGDGALQTYLSNNIKYPTVAAENGIQGKVIVQYVVETDGSISDAKVTRSIDPSLDKEALRLVNAMPKWQPGKQGGKAVRVRHNIIIPFKLD